MRLIDADKFLKEILTAGIGKTIIRIYDPKAADCGRCGVTTRPVDQR